jgi:hypothetical protein
METASGPLPLPDGASVVSATGKGLTVSAPTGVPRLGAILEFDLLLGARPIPVMARVVNQRSAPEAHTLEVEFVALAQVDRDALVDFLQAVGPSSLRLRKTRAS